MVKVSEMMMTGVGGPCAREEFEGIHWGMIRALACDLGRDVVVE